MNAAASATTFGDLTTTQTWVFCIGMTGTFVCILTLVTLLATCRASFRQVFVLILTAFASLVVTSSATGDVPLIAITSVLTVATFVTLAYIARRNPDAVRSFNRSAGANRRPRA